MNELPDKLTERIVQQSIWNDLRNSYHPIMPNFTPGDWWECDIWAVAKASGLWSEFEIKLTAADVKKDLTKIRTHWCRKTRQEIVERKHDQLAQPELGPSRWWLVVPEALADKISVPDYAGLKMFRRASAARLAFVTVKQAPLRNRNKPDKVVLDHVHSACYWRYWNARNDIVKHARKLVV